MVTRSSNLPAWGRRPVATSKIEQGRQLLRGEPLIRQRPATRPPRPRLRSDHEPLDAHGRKGRRQPPGPQRSGEFPQVAVGKLQQVVGSYCSRREELDAQVVHGRHHKCAVEEVIVLLAGGLGH